MPSIPDEQIHPHATGAAAKTVEDHQKPCDLLFHGSWFCPYVQRAWISLQEKGMDYEWKEVNPYKKDKEYLAINPKGLVPALTHHGRNLYESQIIMEYLEDISPQEASLFPKDPMDKANARLWMDHIAKKICPIFFHVLQAQEKPRQKEAEDELLSALSELVEAMDPQGPFFVGNFFSFVDIMLLPWLSRPQVLKELKGFEVPSSGCAVWERYARWLEAGRARPSVIETTSEIEHYLQILERYAKNEAQSEAAKATRAGKRFS